MKSQYNIRFWIQTFFIVIVSQFAVANRASTPNIPIGHCYHWLNERTDKYLTYKYNFAAKNKGELTFHTTAGTSNGAVAGPGLYCAKTPIESYSYGDRVIRIDFVEDVVIWDGSKKVCGINGKYYPTQEDCNSKPVDVHLFNTNSNWYVIKNPQAVKTWSSNSDELIADLTNIKADANSSAALHMDTTIQLINLETKTIAKNKYTNFNSRQTLEKILKDPQLIAKIPVLTLIGMIASHNKVKQIPKDELYNLYKIHFTRALYDSSLSYDDFESLISQDIELKNYYTNLVKQITNENIDKYNIPVILSSVIKNNIDLKKDVMKSLWANSISSSSSIQSLIGLIHKGNSSSLSSHFFASLPDSTKIFSYVKEINLIWLIQLINKFADKSNSAQANLYASLLIDKFIMISLNNSNIKILLNDLSNPHINKIAILKDIALKAEKSDFKLHDPIAIGLAIDEISSEFSKDHLDHLANNISQQPLRINNHLSHIILEDYRNGKFILPSFYSEEDFLMKIYERSISERSLGANTTNTFRLILSNFNNLFMIKYRALKTDHEKQSFFSKKSDFFLELSKNILNSGNQSYSFIALQNSAYYSQELKVKNNSLEDLIASYQIDQKTEMNLLLEKNIELSLDPAILLYLISNTPEQAIFGKDKNLHLIGLMLNYLTSDNFTSYLTSADFKIANEEKKQWANIAGSRKIYSDICSLSKTIHNNLGFISTHFKNDINNIKGLNQKLFSTYCK